MVVVRVTTMVDTDGALYGAGITGEASTSEGYEGGAPYAGWVWCAATSDGEPSLEG